MGLLWLNSIQLGAIRIRNQACECEPEKCRNERQVVQTSRVVDTNVVLHINDQGGQHVGHGSAQQMEVHFFPGAVASQPQKDEPEDDQAILRVGDEVEIVIVLR